jgi:hypothetical protein
MNSEARIVITGAGLRRKRHCVAERGQALLRFTVQMRQLSIRIWIFFLLINPELAYILGLLSTVMWKPKMRFTI